MLAEDPFADGGDVVGVFPGGGMPGCAARVGFGLCFEDAAFGEVDEVDVGVFCVHFGECFGKFCRRPLRVPFAARDFRAEARQFFGDGGFAGVGLAVVFLPIRVSRAVAPAV